MVNARYAFAVVQPGFEAPAKIDIARRRGDWRLAYSRPGLLTYRAEMVPDPAPTCFARVWGEGCGRVTAAEGVVGHLVAQNPDRIHVFTPDVTRADATELVLAWERAIAAELERSSARPIAMGGEACVGERVIDVVLDTSDAAFVGVHIHGAGRSREPGGWITVPDLPNAPSRAWLKLEQAVRWAELPIEANDTVLDIGAAPGGAMAALLRRGVHVWAVDPGALDPNIDGFRQHEHVTWKHLECPLSAVRWEDLTADFDWLLCDIHLAPQAALHQLARIVPPLRRTLRGAIITLKLNEWAFVAALPQFEERIRAMGFAEVAFTHLPENRKEVCAVARMPRSPSSHVANT